MLQQIRHRRHGLARMTLSIGLIACAIVIAIAQAEDRKPGFIGTQHKALAGCSGSQASSFAARMLCADVGGARSTGSSVKLHSAERS